MTDEDRSGPGIGRLPAPLVPRLKGQGYDRDQVAERRRWVEERTGSRLEHIGNLTIPTREMRGNVENPVGAVQIPLGVAGPLRIRGRHAEGIFYVPLATTEGALVRSYERGMVALSRSGGAVARVHEDENRVSPVFRFPGVEEAAMFAGALPEEIESLRREAETTTGHGRLLGIECHPGGREVIVEFRYSTGDAQGMNMIVKATDRACRWIVDNTVAERYLLFSGHGSEKRASGSLMAGGKGKRVVAGARLPGNVVRTVLGVSSRDLVDLWGQTVRGHLHAAALGYNGHVANGLTALFIACGQDVANVANSAVAVTSLEEVGDGDLYASVTLPSLSVATVGGGTGLGTGRECLELLGCFGSGRARKLAEIFASTVLAGELSFGAALVGDQMVSAHETYGRNRPPESEEDGGSGSR